MILGSGLDKQVESDSFSGYHVLNDVRRRIEQMRPLVEYSPEETPESAHVELVQKTLQEAQALVDDVGEHCFKLHDEKVENAMKKLELIAKGSKQKLSWTDGMSTHATFDDMLKHFTTTLAKEDPQELTSRRNALTEAGRTALHHDVVLHSPTLT